MNRKRLISVLSLVIALAFAHDGFANPENLKKVTISDKVGKNQFEWVSSMPLETINGTAEGITGWLTFDPAKPTKIEGEIKASVASMQSGNTTRDEHMHSPMWLDVANHPTITFKAKSTSDVMKKGNNITALVTGDFTMRGVTKQMTIPVTIQYIPASRQTAKRAPGDLVSLTADFSVALKDFNVQGREGVIGSKVGETIAIKAKIFGSTAL